MAFPALLDTNVLFSPMWSEGILTELAAVLVREVARSSRRWTTPPTGGTPTGSR